MPQPSHLEETLEKLSEHFFTYTDGGVKVHYTSDTLKNEDGTGVSIEEYLVQSHINYLQAEYGNLQEIRDTVTLTQIENNLLSQLDEAKKLL
jgi:hypothetical protein